MPSVELPPGRYLSCAFGVAPDMGGQTRALLMRNRFLAREGGVRPDVLTLGPGADYQQRREILLERGLLDERLGLLNIFDHYREHGWGESRSGGAPLADLAAHRVGEQERPDGSPWRTSYRLPGTSRLVHDYLRADGTPYLRIADFGLADKSSWKLTAQQVGPDGTVVGGFSSPGRWFRRWIRELAEGHERAFVFVDSRFVVPHLVPIRGRRFLLLYQMHNMHLLPPRRWDSEVSAVYGRVLARIGGMDAMVNLTERQRDDIAARRGRTSNMFVVPNPVVIPEPPAQRAPRDPMRVTVVARLERQKRLTHAIAAFQQVVEAVPAARLDIYGQGSERERLQAEIDSRGLGGSVVLRGFDPRASDSLLTSSAFLMTSSFEGYPLSTLESMSRGCPVVSYDIKYGPREQITDGVDGFLVPAGDKALLAQRVIELLRSPALVSRMSAAALARAESFGPREFLASWARVLQAAVEAKPHRTRIENARFELRRLRPRRLGRGLRLSGVLELEGKGPLDAVRLSLAWIDVASGDVREQPLRVKRAGSRFRVRATVEAPAGDALLRLRLTWRNSAWDGEVAQASGGEVKRSGTAARSGPAR
jgi:poly(glycerol-phosphate) alpha-glucosyltransferase